MRDGATTRSTHGPGPGQQVYGTSAVPSSVTCFCPISGRSLTLTGSGVQSSVGAAQNQAPSVGA